jgi:hypothetical protein
MVEPIQKTLTRAIHTLLRPLVRILLRNGIAYGSFAELAKKTYVDVAFEDFAPEGKKQTVSRVSALTGLTRKEAKRLHEMGQDEPDLSQQRYNRAIRVISGWLNDAEFHDPSGQPLALPVDGEHGSFAALVKRYSGDMTTQSMLAVLTAAASVAREDDRVRLIQRAYLPGKDPADKLHILGRDTGELIATIDHNLVSGADNLRFQRKVSNHRVRAEALPEFRALSSRKAQALLEEFDAWLAKHEIAAGEQDDDQGRYVSLGMYYYENPEHEEDPS